ncbi:hypothetical protein NITMOv2_1575 [Nitrospira moscoviensis]|uniref:Ribbon-helix-helix protein CopG domain-containing protein n=2 Tax=Nitrospira moscoviensis TaxID=42253 RepID=A0A0K2GAV9_NITMO|nr:hypothetical protein NITMOv2_1575 [Nitrospira moscoviensis]
MERRGALIHDETDSGVGELALRSSTLTDVPHACIILSYSEVEMKRGRVPLTVSVPSELATKFEKLAKAEAKNKSQLFREMVSVYEQRRREEEFLALQRYGARQARKKRVLTEADVEALVFQDR